MHSSRKATKTLSTTKWHPTLSSQSIISRANLPPCLTVLLCVFWPSFQAGLLAAAHPGVGFSEASNLYIQGRGFLSVFHSQEPRFSTDIHVRRHRDSVLEKRMDTYKKHLVVEGGRFLFCPCSSSMLLSRGVSTWSRFKWFEGSVELVKQCCTSGTLKLEYPRGTLPMGNMRQGPAK